PGARLSRTEQKRPGRRRSLVKDPGVNKEAGTGVNPSPGGTTRLSSARLGSTRLSTQSLVLIIGTGGGGVKFLNEIRLGAAKDAPAPFQADLAQSQGRIVDALDKPLPDSPAPAEAVGRGRGQEQGGQPPPQGRRRHGLPSPAPSPGPGGRRSAAQRKPRSTTGAASAAPMTRTGWISRPATRAAAATRPVSTRPRRAASEP